PAIGNLGNIQRSLILVAKRGSARFESIVAYPAAERLADLLEAQMQGPDRYAKVICHALRRQFGVVKMLAAKGEHGFGLQFRLQAICFDVGGAAKRQEVAEILGQ